MKVVHVITGLAAGGAETELQLMVRHSRHEAEVVSLTTPGVIAERLVAQGTPVTTINMGSNRDIRAVFRLARRIRRSGCALVHVHLYRGFVYGRVAARLAGIRHVVSTEHSLGEGYIERRATTRRVRLLYLATEPFSQATIAVSRKVRRRLIDWGVREGKIVVIPNGVDTEALAYRRRDRLDVRRELGLSPDNVVIGALARLVPAKRIDALIRAAAPLLDERVRLLVVGDGPERQALEALAARHGVSAQVTFTGERTDVPRLLSAMDVLVAPSVVGTETFGLMVIEALAAGLRVLYTDCPALDDLPDGGGPHAVRIGDEEGSITRELERLVRSPLGDDRAPSPAIVEHFDVRACSAAVDRLYEGLVESRR